MDIELIEIRDFLAAHHPFDQLSRDTLETLPKKLELRYMRRGTRIFEPDSENRYMYLVRSGAVEIRDPEDHLLSRLGEGDTFGARSLLRDGRTTNGAVAIEDTLLYLLPGDEFFQLREQNQAFAYYFAPVGAQRLREALHVQSAGQEEGAAYNLTTIPISDMISREPVSLPSTETICAAAQKMTEDRVSSILVVDDGKLVGIVTDRDMRSRCVAARVHCDSPLSVIMTPDPLTVRTRDYAYEALLAMVRHNIRHLPVVDGERVAGMITVTDLIQRRSASPVYVVGDIYKQKNVEQLAEASRQLPRVLLNLVEADATAHSAGRIISSVGEAITVRLLQLAEEQLGLPPVPYAWLAAGSLARMEQTAHSDQDNGLLLSDDYDPEAHGAYFEQLARFVNDGLDACGYIYCPGDIMAVNPQWRQPLAAWKRYFAGWIQGPEPKALMHASIFFDLRALHGDQSLFSELQRHILDLSSKNRIFLAYMAANVLQYQPPLGFFRNFVLIRGGEHDHTLDLKHNGVVPIIDLARVYALAAGVDAVNTQERLDAVAGRGEVSVQGARDLVDALEFISYIRLRHQARLVKQGKQADNFLSPEELSNFDRNHLKDAFAVVRTLQSSLGQRYQVGRF